MKPSAPPASFLVPALQYPGVLRFNGQQAALSSYKELKHQDIPIKETGISSS
jgi:hypothetical protein